MLTERTCKRLDAGQLEKEEELVMSTLELKASELEQSQRKKSKYVHRRVLEVKLEMALKELDNLEQRNEKRIAKKQSE